MASINEYFATEAREFLTTLDRALKRTPAPDPAELHRAVRGLRGTAQMARQDRVFHVAAALESVTRMMAAGVLTWSDELAARARDTIADLNELLEGSGDEEQLNARASGAAARWRDQSGARSSAGPREVARTNTREFREFAAREAVAIADALDRGVQELQLDPMNRDALRDILRQQRALLGSARLDEVPVVAEILRSVEDLTRVIARLDVGVKREWLDIYRVARDALKITIEPLMRDEDPQPAHASSRLRHMREELMERYGSGEATAAQDGPHVAQSAAYTSAVEQALAATGAAVAAPAQPVSAEAEPEDEILELDVLAADDNSETAAPGEQILELDEASVVVAEADAGSAVVDIQDLLYTREGALRRALELRDAFTRAAAQDDQAQIAVEELFDLIRIALE